MVSGGGLPPVHPLLEAILAPELRVAVVEGGGDDVVVADLVLRVGAAPELGLLRARIGGLVELVAKRRQPAPSDAPRAEAAAAVALRRRTAVLVSVDSGGGAAGAATRSGPRRRSPRSR
jgi:hypothetical protein